jgi:hypothetical protein
MLGYKTVDVTENDTGDALFSEVLSIPLIMRGEPSTLLWNERYTPSPAPFGGRSLSEAIGLPTLISSGKPSGPGFHGTIFGRIGLPELWK